ncbi:MAG: bifunctional serine/threonine-protein kinase/formylglycine-generating enzyme family protein [Candidatus Cloacimonadaceae bacterium]|nr:bifunctional serine/threonine-protein kinase/formylglycine-generating enzyme family protein [Candidatus Cloacimonadaceae bacterium]
MEFKIGAILRDYHIFSLLGEGGMGEVYLAEERLLDRKVAIKRLNPTLTSDPQFSERFVNESRIQAKLQHHNIVSLYNFFVEDGVYYMVMEYAPGNMLKDVIAETGPIPEQRSLHIFKQIISALGYAHAKQIIHRDIKPSNIMLDANDDVKVMDFGIARLMSDKHLTRTGAKLGTLFYMSPEQVKATKDIDHRTDIYSSGIVLYEMLTGKLPYSADTDSDFDVMLEIVNKDLPDPRKIYQFIGEITVAIIRKATQKQREARYPDCHDLFDACDKVDGKNHPPPRAENTISTPNQMQTQTKNMIYVEGGTFNMGATDVESNERPVHQVTLASFYIGKHEVTQKEWLAVMGSNPSYFKGENLPVAQVRWFDAIDYCNKRSINEGLTACYSVDGSNKPNDWRRGTIVCDWNANGYRLPTEAEWEYAARGGNKSKGYEYAGSNDIGSVAWYGGNSGGKTHPVGSKAPNELGIYDMSGNVWEWCWDWYAGDYYAKSPASDPRGAGSVEYRVLRGGSWYYGEYNCRVANRNNSNPDNGYHNKGLRALRAIH